MKSSSKELAEKWQNRGYLLLAAFLILALFPVSSAAETLTVIDIKVSGQPGNMSWTIGDIKPGFRGYDHVTVTNTGTMDGSLFIWVENITGDYALGKFMFFNVSNTRLVRTVSLPSTIYNFPQSPDETRFIIISPFIAGETITLNWTWEFQETFLPQNEAQGKKLGFIVDYTLKAPVVELDGWYNVSPPEYREVPIPGEPCDKMNQTRQEYRNYTCTLQYCTYLVTAYRWIDFGRVDYDEDNDGICDGDDYCTGTIEWYATIRLLPNHYDSSNMDLQLTHGCSCYQILACKPGNNDGEYNYGCTYGTLNVWYNHTPQSWTSNCNGTNWGTSLNVLPVEKKLRGGVTPFDLYQFLRNFVMGKR